MKQSKNIRWITMNGRRIQIGFTGTQRGMTPRQQQHVTTILQKYKGSTLHHGDCIGADAQAHGIAKKCGLSVEIHPPINPEKRAYTKGGVTHTKKPYLERNRAIVDASDMLIATPKTAREDLRSGTWATVRYARKQKKKIALVRP
jgi:hypothetical protein